MDREESLMLDGLRPSIAPIPRMLAPLPTSIWMTLKVTVITTDPEDITYGKSDVCYELIRTMQLIGINVITRTEVEECFAVIDDEIVWHGGMNLLGKADVWDNLMRIRNPQVATELLEIALGCSEERRKSE